MPADSFESPLTLAACGGHTELASLLIERGANMEEVNDEGYTPLMEAVREGHEDVVTLLIHRGMLDCCATVFVLNTIQVILVISATSDPTYAAFTVSDHVFPWLAATSVTDCWLFAGITSKLAFFSLSSSFQLFPLSQFCTRWTAVVYIRPLCLNNSSVI